MIPPPDNPLIVALDVSDVDAAERLGGALAPEVAMLKVGFELFWAHGPEAVRRVAHAAPVFVDSKLHDIPTTVERASANIARLGVAMMNVHALGGDAMMRAALDGARRGAETAGVDPPLVVAVTVLSSQSGEGLATPASLAWEAKEAGLDGVGGSGEGLATPASLAWEAKEAGLDGVVVSGEDVRDVRDACGDAFCLVVPGIRPRGVNGHDQVRVLTPGDAIERGADYLVVGRAVTGADDPVGVARAIVREVR